MSYPINYPTPQGANIQMFFANGTSDTDATKFRQTWVKPQGVSFVWFTLIGAGGRGGNATSDGGAAARGGGGGGGAATHCLVPAFLIPDRLSVFVGQSVSSAYPTVIYYQEKNDGYELLRADNGNNGQAANSSGGVVDSANGGNGGAASASNYFSAVGFFYSVAGQAGTAGNTNQTTLTSSQFGMGGPGGSANSATSPFGYTRSTAAGSNGYGLIFPILDTISTGDGAGVATTTAEGLGYKAGFGSGGGGATISSANTRYGLGGGDGLCVIISW